MTHRLARSCSMFRSRIRLVLPMAGCLAFVAALHTPAAAATDPGLESAVQRMSYMLGYRIGATLRGQGVGEIDAQALASAVRDALEQRIPRLTEEEMNAAQAEYRAGLAAEAQRRAADNLAAGREFLAANAGKDGVVEMPNGLQYRIHRGGEGPAPSAEDRVVVHYRGRLLDGTEFDSSYRRGEPAEFPVGGVIPGWQAVLQAMSVGSRWEVWIPAEHAYGERGAGGAIGPNQTLHFEIELIEIKPAG